MVGKIEFVNGTVIYYNTDSSYKSVKGHTIRFYMDDYY